MSSMTTKLAAAAVPRLSAWAVAGGTCGLLAAIGALPSGARAVLLLAFIAAGPGAAVLQYWAGDVPVIAQRALVPVVGLAVVILVVSAVLLLGWWAPRPVLLALAAVTVVLAGVEIGRTRAAGR